MNTDLRKKNNVGKTRFILMNNADFGKTMKNVRKEKDIKLLTIERRMNYLVSKANYRATNFFSENLLAIEMKKNADTYE